MITVGIDANKDSYTLVAIDEVGKRVAALTVPARKAGHTRMLEWLDGFGMVKVAVEDCRHLTRALEASLLLAGHQVLRVHTRLMAGMRRSSREPGKSDPIDAEAVARVALREDHLPTAHLAGPDRDLKLFSDHRKRLVEHRTGLQAKLRWFLHELVPDLEVPSRGIRRPAVFEQIARAIAGVDGAVAEIARDLLADIVALTQRITAIERQLTAIVKVEYPMLLAVPGMGALGAAAIIGETAGVNRFTSKDAFARFNGTAPIPVWSGNNVKVRLSRGGNRRISSSKPPGDSPPAHPERGSTRHCCSRSMRSATSPRCRPFLHSWPKAAAPGSRRCRSCSLSLKPVTGGASTRPERSGTPASSRSSSAAHPTAATSKTSRL